MDPSGGGKDSRNMYFKLEMTVTEFQLRTTVLEYEVQRSHINRLRLYQPSADDQKVGHKAENAHCEVLSEWDVPKKAVPEFESIVQNAFGISEGDSDHSYVGPDGKRINLPKYASRRK
jgi:hypothetical protein